MCVCCFFLSIPSVSFSRFNLLLILLFASQLKVYGMCDVCGYDGKLCSAIIRRKPRTKLLEKHTKKLGMCVRQREIKWENERETKSCTRGSSSLSQINIRSKTCGAPCMYVQMYDRRTMKLHILLARKQNKNQMKMSFLSCACSCCCCCSYCCFCCWNETSTQ